MTKPSIGWVGLGNMGTPMVKNIIKEGYHVTVYNRTASKENDLVKDGAAKVDHPDQLWQQCDMVFTMVSDDEAVRHIYEGRNGLLHAAPAGKIAIDMSTVGIETSKHLAAACAQKGLSFLDAPVSGSVKPAQDGTLIILVGGAQVIYNKVKPLFDVLGKLSLYLGENGSGSAAKVAINYLLGLHLQGLSETVLFAHQNGINAVQMLTIINEGALGNAISKIKSQNILNDDFKAAFALKHLAKDLRLAKEAGLDMPLFSPLYQHYQQALAEGYGDEDAIAIYKLLEQKTSIY